MNQTRLVAVIDIGSSAIRLMIAEIHPDKEWKVVDKAENPSSLGRDVFSNGTIRRRTIQQVIQILKIYKELLLNWNISTADTIVMATSAVRAAINKDVFLDRIKIHTDFVVQVIEGVEANELTYNIVEHVLSPVWGKLSRSNVLIMEMSGGSTEVILLHRGKIISAHTLNLGSVRLLHQIESSHLSREQFKDYLRDSLQSALRLLNSELSLKNIKHVVLVGGEARIVGRESGVNSSHKFVALPHNEFENIVQKLEKFEFDNLTRYLNISYEESATLLPTLNTYCQILQETGVADVYIPNASIREGMILSLTEKWSPKKQQDFLSQVRTSAIALAQKFNSDADYNKILAEVCSIIFKKIQRLHQLSDRDILLLEVAALTHDVGKAIHHSAYHKHGEYILINSELFGVSMEQMQVIANIVRYHRKSAPLSSHPNFSMLSKEERLIVLKLCAILRVGVQIAAFVKDPAHDLEVSLNEDDLVIACRHLEPHDARLITARREWNLFEDVYGLGLSLKTMSVW